MSKPTGPARISPRIQADNTTAIMRATMRMSEDDQRHFATIFMGASLNYLDQEQFQACLDHSLIQTFAGKGSVTRQ